MSWGQLLLGFGLVAFLLLASKLIPNSICLEVYISSFIFILQKGGQRLFSCSPSSHGQLRNLLLECDAGLYYLQWLPPLHFFTH